MVQYRLENTPCLDGFVADHRIGLAAGQEVGEHIAVRCQARRRYRRCQGQFFGLLGRSERGAEEGEADVVRSVDTDPQPVARAVGSTPAARIAWIPGPMDADWVGFIDRGFRAGIAGSAVRISTLRGLGYVLESGP